MTAISVSVYEPDGSTFIAHVPRRREVQFLHEPNGDGHGQFEIRVDDPLLVSKPNLLAGGNIVKMRPTNVPGAPVFGWQIEEDTPAPLPEGGKSDAWIRVSGRGNRTVLASGQLYPEHGITATSADDRGFTAASADGPWRVTANWGAPQGVLWTADTTVRAGFPIDFPDTSAYVIWATDPLLDAPAGRVWFRSTITLTADANVGIYATADNSFSLSVDGDVVLESDPTDLFAWKTMNVQSVHLAAGTHDIGVRCDNAVYSLLNPAMFLCTIATLDDAGIPLTVLRRTDLVNWEVHSYGPPEPGWHCASILKQAILESQARDEVQIFPLTLDFDDTHDSNGVAFTDIQSERFPIGQDLLSMLGRLIELGMDADVSPDLAVQTWVRRGTDRTATVRLLPGRDIVSELPSRRHGQVRNSALVRHGTGWVLIENAASVAAHGRRSTSLTLGATDSDAQATQQAQAFFDETAQPQITLPVAMTSATENDGPQPYRDFGPCDTVLAPGVTGELAPARVMSFEATEGAGNQEGQILWAVTLYPEV